VGFKQVYDTGSINKNQHEILERLTSRRAKATKAVIMKLCRARSANLEGAVPGLTSDVTVRGDSKRLFEARESVEHRRCGKLGHLNADGSSRYQRAWLGVWIGFPS
jgi:hypothetical protein